MAVLNTSLKTNAKITAYAAMFYSGFIGAYFGLLKKRRGNYPALILFYHRFTNNKNDTLLPKLHVKSFYRQANFLRRWVDVITLDQLIEHLIKQNKFTRPTVVITIDDGFKDNYDLAFPVLKELHLPATIFLTTGLIGTNKAPWIDEIGNYLLSTHLSQLECPSLFGHNVINISTYNGKREALQQIYSTMLKLKHQDKIATLTSLFEKLGNDKQPKTRAMLSWDEIQEMTNEGISFGAHTLSHPILSRMPYEEAVFEIRESKRIIEERLNYSVRHFAIPNGRDEDFSEELREYCKGLFDSIVTTNFGMVSKRSDQYMLPRFCPPEPLFVFASELARFFTLQRDKGL